MKVFKLFFCLLSLVLFSCSKEQQTKPLSFLSNEFMFDTTKSGGDMTTYFKFKVNRDGVMLTGKSSDCGCSKVEINQNKILNKNDIDSVKVSYDSSIKGRFVRRVYVNTNVKDDSYTLYIKGEVLD